MTIVQLKYVLEIAKTKSINQAANNLFISHSVLSSAMKALEQELGAEIFVRTSKGVVLTPYGEMLVDYVTPIRQQLEQLNSLSHKKKESRPSLSIASIGFDFISSLCAQLLEKYAETGIYIRHYEEMETSVPMLVSMNHAEIGILRIWSCYKKSLEQQFDSLNIQFHTAATLDVGITVSAANPLYHTAGTSVTREQLSPYPIVLYSGTDVGPYSDIFKQLNLSLPSGIVSTASRATMYEILERTNAYCLNSAYNEPLSSSRKNSSRLRTLRLIDCDVKSEIGWIVSKKNVLSAIAQEFISNLAAYFA